MVDLGQQFTDLTLEPEVRVEMAERLYYGPTNGDVELDQDIVSRPPTAAAAGTGRGRLAVQQRSCSDEGVSSDREEGDRAVISYPYNENP